MFDERAWKWRSKGPQPLLNNLLIMLHAFLASLDPEIDLAGVLKKV
jgi:hypothetical protein